MTDSQRRLRRWVLALTFFVIAGAVAAPIIGNAVIVSRENRTQLVLGCNLARTNIEQLKAIRRNGEVLDDIARSLGLPILFRPPINIPEVPAECATLP